MLVAEKCSRACRRQSVPRRTVGTQTCVLLGRAAVLRMIDCAARPIMHCFAVSSYEKSSSGSGSRVPAAKPSVIFLGPGPGVSHVLYSLWCKKLGVHACRLSGCVTGCWLTWSGWKLERTQPTALLRYVPYCPQIRDWKKRRVGWVDELRSDLTSHTADSSLKNAACQDNSALHVCGC